MVSKRLNYSPKQIFRPIKLSQSETGLNPILFKRGKMKGEKEQNVRQHGGGTGRVNLFTY